MQKREANKPKEQWAKAKGCTSEEFVDVMREMRRRLDVLTQQDASGLLRWASEAAGGWWWSWDNDSIHKNADQASLPKQRHKLPPYSPDFHAVVEHCIGRTWRVFKENLRHKPANPDMDDIKACLESAFEEAAAANTIFRDVGRLPLLYKMVCSRADVEEYGCHGSWGDWPHPRLWH